MTNLCIIPARGGSKRIPRKNIKNFCGKPIIAYSIEAAIESKQFKEIMVSTDDEEIAEISIKYGAKVPFYRSSKNSNDFASTMDVIKEVVDNYADKGLKFDYVCCIYPTAPLIQPVHITDGLTKIINEKLACVFPSVAFSYPIWRGVEIDKNGVIKMIWPQYLNSRSQDLKPVYHDAGQWYWFKNNLNEGWEWPENTGSIVLSEGVVQDIDNESDWKMAELKYQLLNQNS